jgi:signal transduction histidine kinase/CheY-like chemotaxis protein
LTAVKAPILRADERAVVEQFATIPRGRPAGGGRARNPGPLDTNAEQLRHARKLEAVGQLAGAIVHDFNNLLTAITGYSEFVLAELDRSDPRRRDVEEIHRAAIRAAALTRQLLAFSRPRVLQPRIVDLSTVVAELGRLLRLLLGSGVELDLSLSSRPAWVLADPDQLEQVVMNLALNSRDAMPEGGTLRIETAAVELGPNDPVCPHELPPGPYVRLTLADTGTGIEPEILSRIFEPFFTTKKPGLGTGLGLATAHGIVAEVGGTIAVESAPGRGSSFTVYLPAARDADADDEELAGNGSRRSDGGETVLLAEDEQMIRELAARGLTERGYTVLSAESGTEALDLSRTHDGPIHVLVTDLAMPGEGGAALASALRELRPEVRVLYVSGYPDAELRVATPAGASFLAKPFPPSRLAEKVREILDERPAA